MVDNIARALAVKPVGNLNYSSPNDFIIQSSVTSGTLNTLTDSTVTWTIDEWKDKIVRVYRDGGTDFEYAIIESNTSDTLTFDDNLLFAPCNLCSYQILNTVVVEPCQLPLMLALDTRLGQCGVILPESTLNIERKYIHVYIERSTNGDHIVPVIARGVERMAGAKNLTLENFGEGIRLYAHQWFVPHWDISMVYNVKRLATGYLVNNEAVTTTEFSNVGLEANVIYDNKRRFVEHIDGGYKWLRYTSLINRSFNISFVAIVQKTGGGGELEVSIAKKDGVTGVVTVLDTRIGTTLFGGGDGLQTINFNTPIELKRNDEIIIVAKRTSGTFTINAGSSITISEF